jgi:DNA-binding MarR family transcriptional regulator
MAAATTLGPYSAIPGLADAEFPTAEKADRVWLARAELRSLKQVAEMLQTSRFFDLPGMMVAMFVDRRCGLIRSLQIDPATSSGLNDTVGKILRSASNCHAHGIILATHAPTSEAGYNSRSNQLTEKLSRKGEAIEVFLLDHLLLTPEGWIRISVREDCPVERFPGEAAVNALRRPAWDAAQDGTPETRRMLTRDVASVFLRGPTEGRHLDPNRRDSSPHRIDFDSRCLPSFSESELDNPQLLARAATEMYSMRKARDRVMPSGLVGEAAWDMLLALYSEQPAKLTVSSLCHGAAVPISTALRWVGILTARALVEQSTHQRDGRTLLLSLTDEGRAAVERCLKAMLGSAH